MLPGPRACLKSDTELSEQGQHGCAGYGRGFPFSGCPWDSSALPRSREGRGVQPLGAGQVKLPRSGKKAGLPRATALLSQVPARGRSESGCGLPITLVALHTSERWGAGRWAEG